MKKLFLPLSFLVICLAFLVSPVWSVPQVIEGEGVFTMGDRDSKAQAKEWALEDAKRDALEKAGTYLESSSQVINGQISKDEIKTLAIGVIKLEKIISENYLPAGNGIQTVKIKAQFSIDNEDLVKRVSQMKNDQDTQLQLAELQEQYNELSRQMNQAKLDANQNYNAASPKRSAQQNLDLYHKWITQQLFSKGLLHFAANQDKEAEGNYDKILKLSPNNSQAYLAKGDLCYKAQKYQLALTNYNKAIKLNPNLARAYFKRGMSLLKLGEMAKAKRSLAIAFRLNPELKERIR